ncbi:hypothetical protein [endosymbiont GvMRE of Glomus versiforme]|uniref:hypothetical protein n=1 Tax=endosymbiont GvMRE of Glomus versiforme TaxID=2039283 RepID=UPI000EEFE718|nr:hypothetical protein [endosymbiont GvMRE of Glomus versiforme]RHZ37283.1 hypothetical protein GvMRE_I1g586 [endosymbiont GvMRE of Glomus versiforme]
MAKNKSQSQYPDLEFKEYLNQLASPNYQGGSWILPENPTPLEKNKHEICREILHSNIMTNEKILDIVRKLSREIIKPEPKKKTYLTRCFCAKGIEYQEKKDKIEVNSESEKALFNCWEKNC